MAEASATAVDTRSARTRWVWRGVTGVWAAAAIWASLRLRSESLDPAVLGRDEDALRRACLGFPLPVMLGASRVHHFRDEATGTQTLSYRLPAGRTVEEIRAYYEDYLRRSGFGPSGCAARPAGSAPGAAGAQADCPAEGGQSAGRASVTTKAYAHADRLRVATVSVHTEPLRGEYRTAIVTVRPALPLYSSSAVTDGPTRSVIPSPGSEPALSVRDLSS